MKTYNLITNLGKIKDLVQPYFLQVSEEEHWYICVSQYKSAQDVLCKLAWLPGVLSLLLYAYQQYVQFLMISSLDIISSGQLGILS